jgi:hypothetical protein
MRQTTRADAGLISSAGLEVGHHEKTDGGPYVARLAYPNCVGKAQNMHTYTAVARSDSAQGWLIRVRGLGAYPDEGLPSWAPSVDDAEAMARDLIASYLDVPANSFVVEVVSDADDS